jgi:hypothetical protein
MPFKYRVRKMHVGTAAYTTRAEFGTPLTEAEVIDQLVKNSSISAGDIVGVMVNLRDILVNAARESRPSETLFSLFRVALSSGGAFDHISDDISVEDLKPAINLHPSAEMVNAFLANLAIERTGVDSDAAPELDAVIDELTGQENKYTPGDALKITGDNLKIDPDDVSQGIFLKDTAGNEVRLTRYLINTSGTLMAIVPATTTGTQTLTVKSRIGPNLRQTVHNNFLVAA